MVKLFSLDEFIAQKNMLRSTDGKLELEAVRLSRRLVMRIVVL